MYLGLGTQYYMLCGLRDRERVRVCVVFFSVVFVRSEREETARRVARARARPENKMRSYGATRRDAKTATMRKTYFTHAHVRPAYKRGRVSSASVGREYHVWVEMEVDMRTQRQRTRVHHTCVGGACE